MIADTELIQQFAGSFHLLGGVAAVPVPSAAAFLDLLHSRLPARLPRLYEQLILSFRWPEVDLRRLCLFPNLEGHGWDELAGEIFATKAWLRCC